MKKHNIIKTIILSSLAILASSCGENAMDEMTIDDTPKTYTLIFNAEKPSFESEEGTTRLSNKQWEDKDRVYFYFNSAAAGYGEYNSTKKQWSLNWYPDREIKMINQEKCKVYYFEGEDRRTGSTDISFKNNVNTAMYNSSEVTHDITNNTLTINAKLKPKAFRFRFKNETNSTVNFSLDSDNKIEFYTGWNYETGSFVHAPQKITGTVGSNSYSDYYYGTYNDSNDSQSSIDLTLTIGNTQYTREFSTSKLKEGESGYFKLPTSSNPNGWTKKGLYFNGHEAVDLGLTDEQGRKIYWATCNIGAERPEDNGLYFAWGETKGYTQYEYHDFSWSNYSLCNGNWDKLTKYSTSEFYGIVDNKTMLEPEDDAAHVYWGGDWRMPTVKEQLVLFENCECTWDSTSKRYIVTGPNGNTIFLPAAGTRVGSDLYGIEKWSEYWSSEVYDYGEHDAFFLEIRDYEPYWFWYMHSERPIGRSIRAVCVSPN